MLALWLFVRLPNRGPQSFKSAGLVVFGACGLLLAAGPATGAADAVAGPVVALLAVFLPVLLFAFWSAWCLVHATIAAAGAA